MLASFLGLAQPGWAQESARRLALVISNDSYSQVSKLENARSDATAIARALERAGFKVTLKTDTDFSAFKAALRAFKADLRSGDEASPRISPGGALVAYQGTAIYAP